MFLLVCICSALLVVYNYVCMYKFSSSLLYVCVYKLAFLVVYMYKICITILVYTYVCSTNIGNDCYYLLTNQQGVVCVCVQVKIALCLITNSVRLFKTHVTWTKVGQSSTLPVEFIPKFFNARKKHRPIRCQRSVIHRT